MNIFGRLTSNATVSKTTEGKEVVNFMVVVHDGYKNKQGQWVDDDAFIQCAYWRTAKVASWLKKGLCVELTGQIGARAWQAKDGTLNAGLNFNTSYIKPTWGTASKDDAVQASKTDVNTTAVKEDENDDLPF